MGNFIIHYSWHSLFVAFRAVPLCLCQELDQVAADRSHPVPLPARSLLTGPDPAVGYPANRPAAYTKEGSIRPDYHPSLLGLAIANIVWKSGKQVGVDRGKRGTWPASDRQILTSNSPNYPL